MSLHVYKGGLSSEQLAALFEGTHGHDFDTEEMPHDEFIEAVNEAAREHDCFVKGIVFSE